MRKEPPCLRETQSNIICVYYSVKRNSAKLPATPTLAAEIQRTECAAVSIWKQKYVLI